MARETCVALPSGSRRLWLSTIRALPAAKARDLFDVSQKQRERVMIAVAVVPALGAVAAFLVNEPSSHSVI